MYEGMSVCISLYWWAYMYIAHVMRSRQKVEYAVCINGQRKTGGLALRNMSRSQYIQVALGCYVHNCYCMQQSVAYYIFGYLYIFVWKIPRRCVVSIHIRAKAQCNRCTFCAKTQRLAFGTGSRTRGRVEPWKICFRYQFCAKPWRNRAQSKRESVRSTAGESCAANRSNKQPAFQ